MADDFRQTWTEGWAGRWFLYACGAVVALVLAGTASVAWPYAIAAGVMLVIAGLVVRRRPRTAAPLDSELLARRAARLTDLTVESLMASLPIPAILLDPKLTVRTFNGRAVELVPGLRRGEPLTLSLRAPDVVEVARRALSSNMPQSVDYAERVPVARWFNVEAAPVAVTPEARDGSRPDFVLLSLRDLTEERRLERLRADFVANASHELRTPLASVVGFIETIQGPARNDVQAREKFLDIMLAQARRMSRLIDDLLSLSRVELNEHVRPVGIVDLVPLLAHVRDTLGPYARGQDVEVEIRASVPALPVNGDQDELIRLFENLVQNAIKYGAEGKRVEIVMDREVREGRRDDAVVTIRDHGPGIPAEHLPRLTERFYRVDVVSSREKGGTGLGLALVKHILNRHRGRLSIDSVPGEGASFTVRIEVADPASSEARPTSDPPA
ncbi:MAG: two-component system OmpR family phosphate regulon sensor histidine kinase PhoR [Xanthobacteraceae bacterium]|nr:MAG: two-component system OmpR family phosphate regulon sensor histidine kinase PhoR [Xanthobacteraceae bacterium]